MTRIFKCFMIGPWCHVNRDSGRLTAINPYWISVWGLRKLVAIYGLSNICCLLRSLSYRSMSHWMGRWGKPTNRNRFERNLLCLRFPKGCAHTMISPRISSGWMRVSLRVVHSKLIHHLSRSTTTTFRSFVDSNRPLCLHSSYIDSFINILGGSFWIIRIRII